MFNWPHGPFGPSVHSASFPLHLHLFPFSRYSAASLCWFSSLSLALFSQPVGAFFLLLFFALIFLFISTPGELTFIFGTFSFHFDVRGGSGVALFQLSWWVNTFLRLGAAHHFWKHSAWCAMKEGRVAFGIFFLHFNFYIFHSWRFFRQRRRKLGRLPASASGIYFARMPKASKTSKTEQSRHKRGNSLRKATRFETKSFHRRTKPFWIQLFFSCVALIWFR